MRHEGSDNALVNGRARGRQRLKQFERCIRVAARRFARV